MRAIESVSVSVLFNEPKLLKSESRFGICANQKRFSALQRAEIAEMVRAKAPITQSDQVSVLFNEPKLLKSTSNVTLVYLHQSFSALQRAEIAEILLP